MEKIIETEGTIFKIKRFSVHDGPGIRTSVFLKGCPLNCNWCHSPEGISSDITIWYDKSLCIACGECVMTCPHKALRFISETEQFIQINRGLCCMTGDCVNICPTGAIQFTGSKITVTDVMNEIAKDKLYYSTSGGGVTLTGGEPFYQPEFSGKILEECRRLNINTAIETSLFCERSTLDMIIDLVDSFIVDMKIFDRDRHVRFTGKPNDLIMDNIRFLSESGKCILVRIPMVDNITDSKENITAIRNFISSIDSRIPIEYINYNPLAENNYYRLGLPFQLK
jgi:pyruvate formate lyase activating enzyme